MINIYSIHFIFS
ncbi:unnamed protein product [Cryptosporidium hominis]|uniref:Uncharacterized protein n=1 Tax=Cryptosporidium hominis TaxID=237895 RepID=A0A0S4TH44_CRYHO|nr:unnamed protein product [Cryptosporidium hominis]